jgi:uncharacterized protein (DUF1330 family)
MGTPEREVVPPRKLQRWNVAIPSATKLRAERDKLRATDPEGLPDAWAMIEDLWSRTVARPMTERGRASNGLIPPDGQYAHGPCRRNLAITELYMPGYVFMHADVTDPDGYEEFKSLASVAIAAHGGRYLVRGGAMQPLEGEWRSRVVLLEFPSYAAALAFYNSDAYQRARQVRLRSSTASVLAMDGVSDS